MVITLVTEDAHEPSSFRRLSGKPVTGFPGCQKRLLDQVFGDTRVVHLAQSKVKEVIPISLHPVAARRRLRPNTHNGIGSSVHREWGLCNGHATTPQIGEI